MSDVVEPDDDDAQPHDWVLSMLVPITSAELERFRVGRQVVFRKVDPRDTSQVRASAVYCATCQLSYEQMGWGERAHCRAAPDDE